MALYDGFFDGVAEGTHPDGTTKYDREYGNTDFTEYFGQVVGSGVCIHNNKDSFKAEYEGGTLYLRPGYLFIQGYWLANVPGEGEDPETYKGYAVTIPASQTGTIAVLAHLNLGKKMIEIEIRDISSAYPDALVLAVIDTAAPSAEDTRHNFDICGVILTAGELSEKVEWAINYINTQVETKLSQIEAGIDAKEAQIDAKIAEAEGVIADIKPAPVGSIRFSANPDMGEEWLECDGSFVSGDDYPDLVSILKGSSLPTNSQELSPFPDLLFSNGNAVFHDNRLWFYNEIDNCIAGVSVIGEGTKKISITGEAIPAYTSYKNISISGDETGYNLYFGPAAVIPNTINNEDGAVSGKALIESFSVYCYVARNFSSSLNSVTVTKIQKTVPAPTDLYKYFAESTEISNEFLRIDGKDWSLPTAITLCTKDSWDSTNNGLEKDREFKRILCYVFVQGASIYAEFIPIYKYYVNSTFYGMKNAAKTYDVLSGFKKEIGGSIYFSKSEAGKFEINLKSSSTELLGIRNYGLTSNPFEYGGTAKLTGILGDQMLAKVEILGQSDYFKIHYWDIASMSDKITKFTIGQTAHELLYGSILIKKYNLWVCLIGDVTSTSKYLKIYFFDDLSDNQQIAEQDISNFVSDNDYQIRMAYDGESTIYLYTFTYTNKFRVLSVKFPNGFYPFNGAVVPKISASNVPAYIKAKEEAVT